MTEAMSKGRMSSLQESQDASRVSDKEASPRTVVKWGSPGEGDESRSERRGLVTLNRGLLKQFVK